MRVPGLKTARRTARQLRSRLVGGGIILGYHRVADTDDDAYGLCVSPQDFSAQMAFLRQHLHPMRLTELVERARTGTLPPRSVAVTFDDGYRDNLTHALPILAQYEIPATLFAVSGHLGGEFWWDEIVRLVQLSPPSSLRAALPQLSFKDHRELYAFLLPLPAKQRQDWIAELWSKAGGKKAGPCLILSEDELTELVSSDWFDIGSHTVNHPLLDMLVEDEQARELVASKDRLESLTGQTVVAFSYPNGRLSSESVALTKQIGYELACTSWPDSVWQKSDPFCLPRIWAPKGSLEKVAFAWLGKPDRVQT